MPRAEAPPIDDRTYNDLVAEVEERIQQYTSGAIEPRADRLTGTILGEDIKDGGETFPAGTLVSRSLAERLAGREKHVKVNYWNPGRVRVEPTLENLAGTVLNEDLKTDSSHTLVRGTPIDEKMAELILAIPNLKWVWIERQPDAGWALVRIFSRMAELVVTRLNRLPDLNFLAFLDLIGTRLNPPQAARVPLTFLLAAGSPVDTVVPAGTQVAAVALEGETEPPLFETERDLVVTRSQLVAAYSRGGGFWDDHTAIATGRVTGQFYPFGGTRKIDHRLYVADPLLSLGEATVELRIGPAERDSPWPSAVSWSFWDGKEWAVRTPAVEVDSARAFWSVQFSDVPRVAASPVNGIDGYWLCGEINATGSDMPQPRIDSLSVRITVDRRDVGQRKIPERGFANQTPLDLSKDFLPFGEKPKVGDTFYLASDEAFSKPGATVDLYVDLSSGEQPAAEGLLLAWEFWNGREWDLVLDKDTLDASELFLLPGTVSFTVPRSMAGCEVNGELRHWIRVRIAEGNYGVEARYEPVAGNSAAYRLIPATFRPPSLRSVRLGYTYDAERTPPGCVLTKNDFTFQQVTDTPFTPFIPSKDSRPSLYLGFERPGDAIGFSNRTTALFFQVTEIPYDSAGEQGQVTREASVVWEYWNGNWQRLGTSDETRGLTRRGLVTFIGPPDFEDSADFGRTAFWLRARWEDGEYAVEPQLARVLTNTMWASHAQTVQGEVLGSSRGERGQVFRTLHAPVLGGQSLEVSEPDLPSSTDLTKLEADEGDDAVSVVRDSVGQPVEVHVRWHEVPDFYDSGPRSRHYVLDHRSGEVQFGDGRRGLVPPQGRDNVRMARYRTGGGLAGNRSAGSITQLKGTVPYVAGVAQPLPAEGGAAEESLEAVRIRGPKALRHRDRAAAAADFEDLAFQASSQVARARALPAPSSSERGRVGLILVPVADVAKPVPDLELLARVRSYLEARLSPVVELWVAGPDWLRVDVKTDVVSLHFEAATDVQNSVLERLRAFLHPLSGGPQGEGWEIGRRPHRSDLYTLIEETPGVDHVLWLEVAESPEKSEARPERLLVFSGNHEITVTGSVDDTAGNPGSPA